MADLLVVLTTVAFFAMCVALVRGCDDIIGPDDAAELASDAAEVEELEAEVVGVVR